MTEEVESGYVNSNLSITF